MSVRQAVILVGGRGTRLGSLAQDIPKPLLPIDGDTRFLDLLIENVARHGLREVVLLAGHLGEQVEARYHGRIIRGARIQVIREPTPAGTGGALMFAKDGLDEVFFMLNGDSMFDVNFLALAQGLTPERSGMLALREVEDAGRFGSVDLNGASVTAFREKDPAALGPGLISGGVYVLRRTILERVTTLPCSIEAEVFPALAHEGLLAGQRFTGYFLDIGLPETLAQAREELMAVTRRPALFLDRDNTLTRDLGYTHKVEDLVWLSGAIAAIRAANDAGFLVIVVTNQSGIGRGKFTEADMHAFHAAMQGELAAAGAHIDGFYFCPYHEDATVETYRVADHPDRKPNPGMLLRAMSEWRIDAARSIMIGDQDHDAEAGRRAGVRGQRTAENTVSAVVSAHLIE